MEDEEPLRTLTRTILEQSGYSVLEGNDGSQAIEIARQHRGPIHVLLTDMVMPGMSGLAVAESLMPVRPEMKVVYMSGYTDFATRQQLDSDASFCQSRLRGTRCFSSCMRYCTCRRNPRLIG